MPNTNNKQFYYNMEYQLGKEKRVKYSNKQRILANLYKLPFISKFFRKALKKAYNLDETVAVNKGFHCETAFLSVGKYSGLGDLWIHGTGKVNIGNFCSISQGCKIITGSHDLHDFNKAIVKTTCIEDYVWIATGSSILQGITIGRGAVISAFSVVKTSIPPYAIASGNPCKIIGFRYTPEEVLEFEKQHYPESERTPLEILQKNYEKYFLSRIKEIKKFVSNS